MFLLDTNVLSAMMHPRIGSRGGGVAVSGQIHRACCSPPPPARRKILAPASLPLPDGRRRADLETAARAMFADDFAERVLPFDSDAALAYADLFAARRQAGRPAATIDLMIAAIARSQGASVVTRNVADFHGFGVAVIDPWQSS